MTRLDPAIPYHPPRQAAHSGAARGTGGVPAAARKARGGPRHPAVALPATILFGLLAAFFAGQAADPLWLALGLGSDGTATVSRCDAATGTVATDRSAPELTYPCVVFEAAGGGNRAVDVTLRGADPALAAGAPVPARMVSPDSGQAYAASPAGLHLRWSVGLALVLACGAGIAWVTGARRLDGPVTRRRAVLLSFAGPLLLAAGFLVSALA